MDLCRRVGARSSRSWVKPKLVAQVEFLEWTDADHLRHSKFVGLREDKDAREVVKEYAGES
jgi:ATP-dependent DNA ligase